MAETITLRPAVDALKEVIKELRDVEKRSKGPQKEKLKLKIKKLVLLQELIIFECGHAYPIFPIAKKR
jgi:hypothetical protein